MPWVDPANGPLDHALPKPFLAHWRKLAKSTAQADPFCCAPIWNFSYHDVFTPERRIFFEETADSAILLGEYITPHGDVILAPMEESWLFGQPLLGDSAPALLKACLPQLKEAHAGKAIAFCLSGIRESSSLAALLFGLFSRNYAIFRHSIFIQASASLAGGLDGWISRRSANHRAKLRKAARRAAAAGVIFERLRPDCDSAPRIYERMLAIEERSWKGLSHNGMSDSPSREFYGRMIRRLAAENEALVMFATLKGQDLGFIFGGILDEYYRGQQFSYIKDAADRSIGNLLQMEQIRWLCELGLARYDMGTCTGPRMEYKLHWTEQFCEAQSWILRQRI